MSRTTLALTLLLAGACEGPTLYVGALAALDAGSDAGAEDASSARDGEAEDDSDDDLPCTEQAECAENGAEIYCDLARGRCEECLSDDHCRRGEHCERGDCED